MTMIYGMAAGAYGLALILFAFLHLRPGHDPVVAAVSDYALGSSRGLFNLYGVVGTVAALLLGVAVLRDGALPRTAGLLLLTLAALRPLVLIFPTDLPGQAGTMTGRLHLVLAVVTFTLSYMALARLVPATLPFAGLAAGALLGAIWWLAAIALGAVVLCLAPPFRQVFGLVERAFLLSMLGGFLTVALVRLAG